MSPRAGLDDVEKGTSIVCFGNGSRFLDRPISQMQEGEVRDVEKARAT
jgi:hypothetical protein